MNPHPHRLLPALFPLLCLTWGCGTGNDQADGTSLVRDSAGIQIVESLRPALEGAESWRLSEDPVVEIGSREGEGKASLYRVNSAVRFADARIALFDGGDQEVRVFGRSGEFLAAMGREGEGPGEFQVGGNLRALQGDTLLVYDLMSGRVTLLAPGGEVAGTVQLRPPEPGGGFLFLARLPDGSYLTRGGTNPMYLGLGTGLLRGNGWIDHLDASGEPIARVTEFRTGETMVMTLGSGILSASVPFGRRDYAVWAGDRLVRGFSASYELYELGLDGGLRRIIRKPVQPRPVTPPEIESYKGRYLEAQAARLERARSIMAEMEFPPSHPVFDDIQVDQEGNVWVEEHRFREQEGPARWSVFAPDGTWVTDVEVPEGLFVRDIGPDYLLGLWSDELDIEYVREYALQKGN